MIRFTTLLSCLVLLAPARAALPPALTLEPSRIVLTVTCDGTPPFTYQWYRNGVMLIGETRPTLAITDPRATGAYHVVISNSAGSVASGFVRLANTAVADAAEVTITRKQRP